ncbi:MAG TPA: response regulator [Candidatus Limnocylindria bacterium]
MPLDARRVLIVEDDDNIADLLLVVLTGEGYATARAGDGEHALEIATTMAPEIILLDMMLPGMHGLEFARRYRERGGRAPIVAVTALPDTAQLRRDGNITAVLRKPFELEALLVVVAETLARQTPREA